MKTIYLTSALAFLFLIFSGCEKAPEDQILGTWKVEDVESTAKMTEAEAEMFKNTIVEEQKQLLSYTFEQNDMKMIYGDDETVWNWMLTGSGDSLKLSISNEDRQLEYMVDELSKDALVLAQDVYDEYTVTTFLKRVE
jgi:hypothetical protein